MSRDLRDVIRAIDGTRLDSPETVANVLSSLTVGSHVALTVARQGDERTAPRDYRFTGPRYLSSQSRVSRMNSLRGTAWPVS